jgi:hypothetical protein
MIEMTEPEWKILREVKAAALERHCARILERCQAVIGGEGTSHERYLSLWKAIEKGDGEIGRAFDGLSRSTAMMKLAMMASMGLVTSEELARFEPRTLEAVRFMLGEHD